MAAGRAPEEIAMLLHANWGHASAHQLQRVLVDSDGDQMHLPTYVDEVSEQCEVRRTFENAPHLPVAATSSESAFHENIQADPLVLRGIFALCAIAMYSKYCFWVQALSKNPLDVQGALPGPWIAVFGRPRTLRMDSGDEWRKRARADFCPGRNTRPQRQGKGAHP